MKLNTTFSAEFKNLSILLTQTLATNNQGQMIAPGASTCSFGCSCSCSCGVVNKSQ